MPAHLQDEHRHDQDQANPEPTAHVRVFGVRTAIGRDRFRLQRHAADRARSRPLLAYLGMHGAGIDRPLRCGLDRLGMEIAVGIGCELGQAAGRTEVIGRAEVLGVMRTLRAINGHAADGIDHRFIHCETVCKAVVMSVIVLGTHRRVSWSNSSGVIDASPDIPPVGIE